MTIQEWGVGRHCWASAKSECRFSLNPEFCSFKTELALLGVGGRALSQRPHGCWSPCVAGRSSAALSAVAAYSRLRNSVNAELISRIVGRGRPSFHPGARRSGGSIALSRAATAAAFQPI